jgi:hypothetical protein
MNPRGACVCVCVPHTHTYIHTYIHMYVCMYTHTHSPLVLISFFFVVENFIFPLLQASLDDKGATP